VPHREHHHRRVVLDDEHAGVARAVTGPELQAVRWLGHISEPSSSMLYMTSKPWPVLTDAVEER
jgi:hypothetical protein